MVGHRVVHGGERFSEALVIDYEVLGQVEALNPLAPLTQSHERRRHQEARRVFPAVPHVAVFEHRVSPHAAVLCMFLRSALRVLREEERPPLRIPRIVARLCLPPRLRSTSSGG